MAYRVFRGVCQIWKLLLESEVDTVPVRIIAVDDEVGRLVRNEEIVTAMDHGQVSEGGGVCRLHQGLAGCGCGSGPGVSGLTPSKSHNRERFAALLLCILRSSIVAGISILLSRRVHRVFAGQINQTYNMFPFRFNVVYLVYEERRRDKPKCVKLLL